MLYCLVCKDCLLSRPYRLLNGAKRNAELHKAFTGHQRISITEKRETKARGRKSDAT